jgi:hypothetical protein
VVLGVARAQEIQIWALCPEQQARATQVVHRVGAPKALRVAAVRAQREPMEVTPMHPDLVGKVRPVPSRRVAPHLLSEVMVAAHRVAERLRRVRLVLVPAALAGLAAAVLGVPADLVSSLYDSLQQAYHRQQRLLPPAPAIPLTQSKPSPPVTLHLTMV